MVIGVREDTSSFLKHLTEKGISLGKTATVIAHDAYDHHLQLQIDHRDVSLSGQVAQHILVKLL
jgi:DtxR family Mn-dependent transcriptional regulator